jgi:hypothetical protein
MREESELSEMFVVGYIMGVILLFIIAAVAGVITADKAMTANEPDPTAWNDVTFAYISTADTAGNYYYYDVDTGIVYKGGQSAFKPAVTDDGYLIVWKDGKMETLK